MLHTLLGVEDAKPLAPPHTLMWHYSVIIIILKPLKRFGCMATNLSSCKEFILASRFNDSMPAQ